MKLVKFHLKNSE